MDIALKTLVLIIFILVPGFIFRRVYFQGTFSKQFDSKSWSHSLFYSALFGIVLNFIGYTAYEYFFKTIDYHTCLELYNSISEEKIDKKTLKKFNIISAYKYLSLLYTISIILGWLVYISIRNLKLDRYFEPLRFLNHWHYYFTGEIKDFKEFTLQNGRCSVVAVDVLVKSEKEGNNLYSGLLSSYSLDNNGNLESIALTQAQIFKYDKKEFKDIHSHVFIIPNSTIQNLNLRYTFQEEDNTIINFLTTSVYTLFLIYVWFDINHVFIDYNFLSKIALKMWASFAGISIPAIIDVIFRYFKFDLKLKNIPKNSDLKKSASINKENEIAKTTRNKLNAEFKVALFFGMFFFGILALILYITA